MTVNRYIANGNKAVADNRLDDALREFTWARAIEEVAAEAACGCGNVWHHRGFLDKAREEYEAAIRLRPSYSRPYFNLATIRLHEQDYRGAVPLLEKCLTLEETFDAMFWLGFSYLRISNLEDAIEWFTKCVSQDQKNVATRLYRGIALGLSDRLVESIADIEAALQLDPSLPGALEWHHYVASRLGRR